MKAIYVLCLLFIFTAEVIKAQPVTGECKKFRTGKFQVETEGLGTVKIERTKRRQIEYFTIDGKNYKAKYRIRWKGDCDYTLYFIKSNLHSLDDYEHAPLHVKIMSSDENGYTYQCQMSGKELIQQGRVEVWK